MKGSFIFKPTNRSYILLPHVPTSFQGILAICWAILCFIVCFGHINVNFGLYGSLKDNPLTIYITKLPTPSFVPFKFFLSYLNHSFRFFKKLPLSLILLNSSYFYLNPGRRNFHVIADVKTLPIKNIYTADQVAHQKSLMLAESERKKALAEQNGGFDNRRNTTFLPTHYETYHPQGYNDQPRRKDEDYAKDMSNSRKRKKVNKCRGSKKKANW